MPLTVQELVEKAINQRQRKRYSEALMSALKAIELDRESMDAWWQAALSWQALGNKEETIAALRKTVELCPEASNAWARLGELLSEQGEIDEAREAFEMALEFDSEQLTALYGMSTILAREDDKEQDDNEISILERIERLSGLTPVQINRFGILHYRNARYHESIRYWSMDLCFVKHPSQRFNLGLAYSVEAISREADAIDMWRMTLRDWPDYEPPFRNIVKMLPKLLDHAKEARKQGETLLSKEQWFDTYINPFQLLNISRERDLNELGEKTIQVAKKALLREVELEDGKLSWLPEISIDKSRAIGVCEELNDASKREWHALVFSNKPLLDFLSKGAHEHFLVRQDRSELDTLDRLEWDEDFLAWLGPFFAPQFDRVLTKAINQGNVVIVQRLLDGRCWVPASMMDSCFANARRAVEHLLEPLKQLLGRADSELPCISEVEHALHHGALLDILNCLPTYFEKLQKDTVLVVRGLALKACNQHDNTDLSRQIINLAKYFTFCPTDTLRQIDEDIEAIDALIYQEREYEVKRRVGRHLWEVTKEGVRLDNQFISAPKISSVRWGAVISGAPSEKLYSYLMEFVSDTDQVITFLWHTSDVRHVGYEKDLFLDLVQAVKCYILTHLIKMVEKKLASGQMVNIGPCEISDEGITFGVKGWIFTRPHFVPWSAVQISLNNGQILVVDTINPNKQIAFSFMNTKNAELIRIIESAKNGSDD